MAQNNKVYIKLPFNKKLTYSKRIKVIEFWKFVDSVDYLKPYQVTSIKKSSDVKDAEQELPKSIKRLWHDQLKVFQEHGLDKVALAARKTCKICQTETDSKSLEFADSVKEPYEELLNDMKVFDERQNVKTKSTMELVQKKSSVS